MLSSLSVVVRIGRRVAGATARTVQAAARAVADRVAGGWCRRGRSFAEQIAVGARAGAVLGAVMGYVPLRDALATVIAALFGITVHGAPDTRGPTRFTDPYERY